MTINTSRTQYRILYLLVTALVLSLPAATPRAYPAEKPPIPGALIIVDFTGSGGSETPAVYFFYRETLDDIIIVSGDSQETPPFFPSRLK